MTGLTLVFGMNYSLYWGNHVQHAGRWDVPGDLWFTLQSSTALVHGHLGAVYSPTDHLITFPGILLVLAPAAALVSALHLPIGLPFTAITYPTAWVVAGPYEILVGSSALFALDAVAEHLMVRLRWRVALVPVQAFVLAVVDVVWGHPEDALALALLLWGALAFHDGRTSRGGWLLGAAVATQPLVILALPVVVLPAVVPAGFRRLVDLRSLAATSARIVLPSAALLAGPLAAGWSTTVHALIDQPNYVLIDHPTPWARLAPKLGPGVVASGPGRLLAVAVATAIGLAACMYRRRIGYMPLEATLWAMAIAMALRCAFEPVLVAYYVWPTLALALAVSARRDAQWVQPVVTAIAALGVSQVSLEHWTHPLAWWMVVLAGLLAVIAASCPTWRVRSSRMARFEEGHRTDSTMSVDVPPASVGPRDRHRVPTVLSRM
jgi:hypothetical protein